jgi:hypothetical protein
MPHPVHGPHPQEETSCRTGYTTAAAAVIPPMVLHWMIVVTLWGAAVGAVVVAPQGHQ